MSMFARLSRSVRTSSSGSPPPSMESLENRTLLSAVSVMPAVAAISSEGGTTIVAPTPVNTVTTIPVKIQAVAGVAYSGDVGMIKGLSAAWLPRLSATIQWGDGTTVAPQKATLVFDSAGVLHVQGAHTYAKAGTFAVTVSVVLAPPAGTTTPTQLYTINSSATVTQNSQGGVTIFPLLKQPFTGVVGTFTFASPVANPVANPVAPVLSAQIQWGDGGTSAGKLVLNTDGTYSVVGAHTYTAVGTYRIIVLVTETTPIASPAGVSGGPILLLDTIYSTAVVQAALPVTPL